MLTPCRLHGRPSTGWIPYSRRPSGRKPSGRPARLAITDAAQSADTNLMALLAEVARGRIRPEDAALQIGAATAAAPRTQPDSAPMAADTLRSERTGFPEVIWGPGKTPLQIVTIMHKLIEQDELAVATRIEPDVARDVQAMLPSEIEYIEQARMLVLRPASGKRPHRLAGSVAVITAGTGDAFVAEECRRTAEIMGCYTFRLQDVGINSGLDRIVQNLPAVRAADVVVVISGMDGSLPSVIAGLVDSPVIAVPTSVGYGAALGGISPLLSALTAGAPGVATVNIDNGFGAAMLAARILKTAGKIAANASTMQAQQQRQQRTAAPVAGGAANGNAGANLAQVMHAHSSNGSG